MRPSPITVDMNDIVDSFCELPLHDNMTNCTISRASAGIQPQIEK